MSNLLTVTRAARLVGVTRAVLQKKIQDGEMLSYDGLVSVENLLACYPDAQLEDSVELKRIALIKERAFGKRVFERALPDAEVLAVRITELSKKLARNEAQVKQFNAFLPRLWEQLSVAEAQVNREAQGVLAHLKLWIKHEVAAAMELEFSNPLAIKDSILRVMTAHVTVLPSQHDFLLEGQDSLLEAAMRAGIPLNYGCSGGNCGLCKAKIISGEVKQIRHHDFVLSEADKNQGCVLLCSHTAVTDVTLEAAVAGSVQDIPVQQITAKVKAITPLADTMRLLHLQTPRTQRLRFLAGQNVSLRVGASFTSDAPIASCPCDDRNLLFHLHSQPGHHFSDYIFTRLNVGDEVELTGPSGEFILHEKSPRALYFFAFDGGFAPIKSLVEHAMSLEVEAIHLQRIASTHEHLYLPKVGRAWADALDNFHYAEHIAGFDLRAVQGQRVAALRKVLQGICERHSDLIESDVYLAGPESAVLFAEQFFTNLGLPKSRVFVDAVK